MELRLAKIYILYIYTIRAAIVLKQTGAPERIFFYISSCYRTPTKNFLGGEIENEPLRRISEKRYLTKECQYCCYHFHALFLFVSFSLRAMASLKQSQLGGLNEENLNPSQWHKKVSPSFTQRANLSENSQRLSEFWAASVSPIPCNRPMSNGKKDDKNTIYQSYTVLSYNKNDMYI